MRAHLPRLLTASLCLALAACSDQDQGIQNPFDNGLLGQKLDPDQIFGGTLDKNDIFGSGNLLGDLLGGGRTGGDTGENLTRLTITATGVTQTIDRRDRYDLTVSGSDNVLTIGEDNDIRKLLVSGDRNTITVGQRARVETLELTGFNNLVRVPAGSGITIARDTGADNTLESY